jgi:hypothetical protein
VFFSTVRDLSIVCYRRNRFLTKREGVRVVVASCSKSIKS